MSSQGPVVPRRRIAQELRRLREKSGRTLEEVATELMISTSKLSRLENAQGNPKPRDVRDLIRLYGVEGTALADKLQSWTNAAQEQNRWSHKDIPAELGTHLAYESEAATARVYTIPTVPVLLQTAEYSRAYYRESQPQMTSSQIDGYVELRQRRQKALDQREGRPPLTLVAVVHESALYQLVGSTTIMRRQLEHLIERSGAPNIEVRVFPFSAPPLFSSSCTYGYFEFSEPADTDVVDIDSHGGMRHIGDPDTVRRYREHFDNLYRVALPPAATRARIRAVVSERYS